MQIGLPYTINFTDQSLPGKEPFVIEPNTTNGPLSPNVDSLDSSATKRNTSIVLPGMGLLQYGERLEESIVHLLENFASKLPPVSPTIGQLWYDYAVPSMKVWDGVTWTPVGSNGVKLASTAEYNSLIADINYIIGIPSGNDPAAVHGYGQTPFPTISNRAATSLEWLSLINAVRKAGMHQGTDVSKLVDTDFVLPGNDAVLYGMMTMMQMFSDLKATIATCKTNKNNVDVNTLETDLSGAGNFQRVTSWSGTIEHQVRLTFTSDRHARAFFNTGGSINISATIDQTVNPDDAAFRKMLVSMGTTKMKAFTSSAPSFDANVGFYSLTKTDQLIRTTSENGNTVNMKANYDSATFSLTVRVEFKTVSGAQLGTMYNMYSDGTINGHLLSSIGMQKASEQYLNAPEIIYPQVSTIRALT